MPRYYFNLRDGDELVPDHEGIELTAYQEARNKAVRGIADCARDAICDAPKGDLAIEVVDNLGKLLFVARLTFATEFLEIGDAIGNEDNALQRSGGDPVGESGQPDWIKHRNLSP
jgi:hypothetical protein